MRAFFGISIPRNHLPSNNLHLLEHDQVRMAMGYYRGVMLHLMKSSQQLRRLRREIVLTSSWDHGLQQACLQGWHSCTVTEVQDPIDIKDQQEIHLILMTNSVVLFEGLVPFMWVWESTKQYTILVLIFKWRWWSFIWVIGQYKAASREHCTYSGSMTNVLWGKLSDLNKIWYEGTKHVSFWCFAQSTPVLRFQLLFPSFHG